MPLLHRMQRRTRVRLQFVERNEVRARATQVSQSAVMYAAHATLLRGYAIETGQGHAWLTGVNGAVSRFVESDAAKASVAHLLSGYRDTGARASMRLGHTPLVYYNNTKPTWWPATAPDQWRFAANNTDPSTASGLSFWADVCAGWCVRRFEDESEFMEVDMTVAYGVASVGRCSCYAYQDTDTASTHAGKNSHAAPDDLRALEWLHSYAPVPSNLPNNPHVFAMKKEVGEACGSRGCSRRSTTTGCGRARWTPRSARSPTRPRSRARCICSTRR